MSEKVIKSSGNVFEDIGVENSAEYLRKADLAIKLIQLIEKRDLTQEEAADLIGAAQPDISKLKKGLLDGFTMDRLCSFLESLDMEVEVKVRPRRKIRVLESKPYAKRSSDGPRPKKRAGGRG